MAIETLALRDQMSGHLRSGAFAYFGPTDVGDYPQFGQFWVQAWVAPDCRVRMIYDYGTGQHRAEFPEKGVKPPREFYLEMASIAEFWGSAVAANSTKDVVRRRASLTSAR